MYVGSHDAFADAQLTGRIKGVLRRENAGNGTPLAAAVVSALQLDLRISGDPDGSRRLAALTDDEISDIGFDLQWTIQHKGSEFSLPLGTNVRSRDPGDITLGGEHWILDAGRPGLHPMEQMRRDAHGPNLEILLAQIRRLTRNSPCRRIGLPSTAHIVDVDDRHLLHFAPFAEAGDVVLQRSANGTDAPRFSAALPDQILEFAASIVADMKLLWKRRKEIGAQAAAARELLDAAAAKHGVTVGLVAIDLSSQHDRDRFDFYAHYEALDEAMRQGPVLEFLPASRGFGPHNYCPPTGVAYRPEELRQLRSNNADGWIDAMAAALATIAPGGPASVFATLATNYEASFTVTTGRAPMFVTLYWRDGTIKAEISMKNGVDWCQDWLELANVSLPETITTLLPGRTVDTFVELPFRCPVTITEAQSLHGGGLRLRLDNGKRLVRLSTGSIWGDPVRD